MKSICIKTNNIKAIEYLLRDFQSLEFKNVYYSCLDFKKYTNIIIHYTGNDYSTFIYILSTILSNLVLNLYEEKILNKILHHEYFYFSQNELSKILFNIKNDNLNTLSDRFNLIFDSFYNYISYNKRIFLDGFITFRLKNYVVELFSIIDRNINNYLIEREYYEFISLLKIYISSENTNIDLLHLIYSPEKSTLLDNNLNNIPINNEIFNAKYLSDISFSSNDYILNMLLSLLPNKIYIHLINCEADEFINSLILIFEHRINLCNNCYICNKFHLGVTPK